MSESLGYSITLRDRADLWRGRCLCVTLVAAALAFSYHLTSFLHAKEAVLSFFLVLLAVLGWLRGGVGFRGIAAFLPLWIGVLAAFFAGQNSFPTRSVEEIIRISSMLFSVTVVFDLLAHPHWRSRIKQAFLVSATLSAGLGIAQYMHWLPSLFPVFPGYDQAVYSVFGNQDLFGGYLAMAMPVFLDEWLGLSARGSSSTGTRHVKPHAAPGVNGVSFGILTVGLVLSGSRSAWLAACVGLICVMMRRRAWNRRMALLVLIGACGIAVTVGATWPKAWDRLNHTFSSSDTGGRIRLWIWDGTIRMVRDTPWYGLGLGRYGYWSPRYLAEALEAPRGERHAFNELDTPDAHCEPLQCMAEMGVIGLVMMLWMLLRLLRRRGPEWGGLAAFLVFSLLNAAWHSLPHALGGLLLAGMLLQPLEKTALNEPGRRFMGGMSMALLSILLAAAAFWTIYLPSYLQSSAEDVHRAGGNAIPAYDRVFAQGWPNAQGRELYAMALLDAGRAADARKQISLALEGVDSGRAYLVLGLASEQTNDAVLACAAYRACLQRWPANAQAWNRLYALTPDPFRKPLTAHARRWGITPAPSE